MTQVKIDGYAVVGKRVDLERRIQSGETVFLDKGCVVFRNIGDALLCRNGGFEVHLSNPWTKTIIAIGIPDGFYKGTNCRLDGSYVLNQHAIVLGVWSG